MLKNELESALDNTYHIVWGYQEGRAKTLTSEEIDNLH